MTLFLVFHMNVEHVAGLGDVWQRQHKKGCFPLMGLGWSFIALECSGFLKQFKLELWKC